MITLLIGENAFERDRAVAKLKTDFTGEAELVDGSTLELRQLPDLLMSGTLFADKRLVIIKNLSENTTLWADFADWIARISDDISLVLIDPKPDKRTRTYKDLQKNAMVREFQPWTDRDSALAEKWVIDEAKNMNVQLDKKLAQLIVNRVGFDQWHLFHALEKLSLTDTVNEIVITDIIETTPTENVFNLFEAALKGNIHVVQKMIATLELTEDPYRLFGLLSGQAFQLAALVVSDQPASTVAKDIAVHPYALSKLVSYAKKLNRNGARKLMTQFADTDAKMKLSVGEPWLLIEQLLLNIANL